MRAHMKQLAVEALPGPEVKLQLIALAIQKFGDAGYQQIGMDHFALPDDELARAIASRTLNRNFMGYTVQSSRDMVALGISAIGDVQGTFVQNTKKLTEYYAALDAGRFPVERGYSLDADDLLRRHVITELMCNFHLDIGSVERRFDVVFADYFESELAELTGPDSVQADGLVHVTPAAIDVTPLGRLFIRNVCMTFDRYLQARTAGKQPVFSRTV
jgi:oxygen-independent coproporphyrinogen-3 oxidase